MMMTVAARCDDSCIVQLGLLALPSTTTHNRAFPVPWAHVSVVPTLRLCLHAVCVFVPAGLTPTHAVSPMPGDPVATLTLLPTMLSINIGSGLDARFTTTQLLAAYPSFVKALQLAAPPSTACVDAAYAALVALAEICRLRSTEIRVLPPYLRKVRHHAMHTPTFSHDTHDTHNTQHTQYTRP